jgi:hypothetical protein
MSKVIPKYIIWMVVSLLKDFMENQKKRD